MIDNFSQDSEESLSSFSDLKTNQSSFKNEYLEACLNLKRPDYVLEFEKQINLRSFAETEIKTPLNFCFSQFEQVQGSNIKIDEGFLLINNSEEEEEDDDDEEDEEMSFEEEIENIFESSLKNNKKQQLRELNENIFIAMKKENLITNIKKYYSDLLKYHQEDIFILLQQHPKYNNFEVQLYTPEYFQLKCTKDNDSKTLILKKYNSFQSIDEEEQFINQRAINSNNLILTETIPLGRFYYLLTEVKYFKPVREIFFYHSIEELIKHSRNDKQLKLQVVKLLIEISYELLTKQNIKITNINPSKILIQGNDKNIQKSQIFGIIIQQINFDQFDQKYKKLINCNQRNTYYQPNAIKLNTLIDEFFTYLNLNKSQEVARLYVDIIEHISLLKLVEVNGGLKIYGYNKLHKDFIDRTIELIKQQQKVSSLSIQLNDYFELTKNNLNFDCKNQFLEQNWRLSPEQQEEFLKHYKIFESYFEKMELIKSDIQNKNQLQSMLELKNMLNICFDCNIIGEVDFQIGIIRNASQFFNKFHKKFKKIDSESDYILRDVSQILQVKMNLTDKKIKMYFALVQQKIFILSIYQKDTLICQELSKEMFSLINIQRFIQRIRLDLVNKNQYSQKFDFIQQFDNLQRLTLNLFYQDTNYLLRQQGKQINLFQQNKKLLCLELNIMNSININGLLLLTKEISQIKNINTIIFSTEHEVEKVIKNKLLKMKKLVVLNYQYEYSYNQNQNIGFFNDHVEVNYIIPSYQNYFHSNVIEDIEFIQDIHDNEYSELINE